MESLESTIMLKDQMVSFFCVFVFQLRDNTETIQSLVGFADCCELEKAGLATGRACKEDGKAAGLGEKRTQHVLDDST